MIEINSFSEISGILLSSAPLSINGLPAKLTSAGYSCSVDFTAGTVVRVEFFENRNDGRDAGYAILHITRHDGSGVVLAAYGQRPNLGGITDYTGRKTVAELRRDRFKRSYSRVGEDFIFCVKSPSDSADSTDPRPVVAAALLSIRSPSTAPMI